MSCPDCNENNLSASCFFCRPSYNPIVSCSHTDGSYVCDLCTYNAMRNSYSVGNTDIYGTCECCKDENQALHSETHRICVSCMHICALHKCTFKKSLWQKIKGLFK